MLRQEINKLKSNMKTCYAPHYINMFRNTIYIILIVSLITEFISVFVTYEKLFYIIVCLMGTRCMILPDIEYEFYSAAP